MRSFVPAPPAQSSARSDKLELRHWVKTRVQHPGMPPVVADWKEVGGDYAFAKYNKKVAMVMYNDEEYNSMLNDDLEWSREETNYLFSMCETFDLRFIIIADRYDFQGIKRTVEQLKVWQHNHPGELPESNHDYLFSFRFDISC